MVSRDPRDAALDGVAGYLEHSRPFTIGGWALNDRGDAQVVELVVGNSVLARIESDIGRPDLGTEVAAGFFLDVLECFVRSEDAWTRLRAETEGDTAEFCVRIPETGQCLSPGPFAWNLVALADALEERLPDSARALETSPELHVDFVGLSPNGAFCVVGWLNDEMSTAPGLEFDLGRGKIRVPRSEFFRFRRSDVESHLYGVPRDYEFGFMALVSASGGFRPVSTVALELSDFPKSSQRAPAQVMTDATLLSHALQVVGHNPRTRNSTAAFLDDFEARMQRQIAPLWDRVRDAGASHSVYQIGPRPSRPRLSIATVLFQSVEPLASQAALTYGRLPPGSVDIIIGNNSPELEEAVLREAELVRRVYGHSVTVLAFHDNCGFGPANNACLAAAKSEHVLLLNPDAFPLGSEWVDDLMSAYDQVGGLMGAVLYYADGSIMHDGMEMIVDRLPRGGNAGPALVLRVNHFAKGAPPTSLGDAPIRRVDAVSGAFMFAHRGVFDRVGAFDGQYVYGHYEDADLCLRLSEQGVPVSVARAVKFNHLEGRGSRWLPQHAGASLYNRCLFTRRWGPKYVADEAS